MRRFRQLLCKFLGHKKPRRAIGRYWVCERGCGLAVIEAGWMFRR